MTLKPPKSSSADVPRDRFWHTLSHEFSFDHQQDGQMEQHLQAIAETWMICTGELFDQSEQATLPQENPPS